jgi:hypothetical protein
VANLSENASQKNVLACAALLCNHAKMKKIKAKLFQEQARTEHRLSLPQYFKAVRRQKTPGS